MCIRDRGYEVVDGQLVKTGFDFGSFFSNVGIVLLLLVLLGGVVTGIVFAILTGIKRGICLLYTSRCV